jgi:hypothetical protein
MSLYNPNIEAITQTVTPKRKAPRASRRPIKEDMNTAQKNGVIQWNLMVDILKENGLME